jgi:hypothetical protein
MKDESELADRDDFPLDDDMGWCWPFGAGDGGDMDMSDVANSPLFGGDWLITRLAHCRCPVHRSQSP